MSAVIAVTSWYGTFYPDGGRTGLTYTEALHPFNEFKKSGYKVTIVSETGAQVDFDDLSTSPKFLYGEDRAMYDDPNSEFNICLKNVKKASEVDPKDFNIFYAAGGHGTVMDFETASGLQRLAEEIYSHGGIVSAVCHGPMVFRGMKDADGESFIKGKKIAGFMDEGEEAIGLTQWLKDKKLPFTKESIEAAGGIFHHPTDPWEDYSIADGRIVTGTNPASAGSVAKLALKVAGVST
uniref:D-lactate dehydratase n=1 Tax=Blastobotrys adeninivorans TaxID=409370 RepID=A0A060T6P6_BLAAD